MTWKAALKQFTKIAARLGRTATANDEEDRDTVMMMILTAGLPATCVAAGFETVW
jgi:hypothetical protein